MKNKVLKIASNTSGVWAGEIRVTDSLKNDLHMTSFDIAEFHLELSEQFKIMEDMPDFKTIGECINWLSDRGFNE